MAAQISRLKKTTYKPTYVREKRTRSYTEEDLQGSKWPIDRSTNTAADTATASAEATTDAPDALVDALKEAAVTDIASVTLLLRRRAQLLTPLPLPIRLSRHCY